jgi:hypothetical protein
MLLITNKPDGNIYDPESTEYDPLTKLKLKVPGAV